MLISISQSLFTRKYCHNLKMFPNPICHFLGPICVNWLIIIICKTILKLIIQQNCKILKNYFHQNYSVLQLSPRQSSSSPVKSLDNCCHFLHLQHHWSQLGQTALSPKQCNFLLWNGPLRLDNSTNHYSMGWRDGMFFMLLMSWVQDKTFRLFHMSIADVHPNSLLEMCHFTELLSAMPAGFCGVFF